MGDWKPAGYPSLSAYVITGDARALLTFAEEVLGGQVLRRYQTDDGRVMHAEIRIDDSVVMVGEPGGGIGAAEAHLHLYVPDAQATYDRALAFGATSVQAPARKEDGDLRGGVRDGSGTTWWLATQ